MLILILLFSILAGVIVGFVVSALELHSSSIGWSIAVSFFLAFGFWSLVVIFTSDSPPLFGAMMFIYSVVTGLIAGGASGITSFLLRDTGERKQKAHQSWD